jgi:hypothetical protein
MPLARTGKFALIATIGEVGSTVKDLAVAKSVAVDLGESGNLARPYALAKVRRWRGR